MHHQTIAMVATGIVTVSLVGVVIRGFMLQKDMKNTQSSIETIQKDTLLLEEELKALQEENTALQQEAASIEDILWRYEPIVIPESMQ